MSPPSSGSASKTPPKSAEFPPISSSSSFAIEALDRREWPRTEAEIHLLRSAMFTAQANARDMAATGRSEEIEEIARAISKVAPELPPESDEGQ